MTSFQKFSVSLISIILLMLCTGRQAYSQERESKILEDDLKHRALIFALEEYNRAIEFGLAAERLDPPARRKSEYREMRKSVDNALQVFDLLEEKPEEYYNLPTILIQFWAAEHNEGVLLMTDEERRRNANEPNKRAREHLENAMIILPDSLATHRVLASLEIHEQDTTAAVALYEQVMEQAVLPHVDDYEFMVELYIMQNRFQEAAELAEEASQAYPEETAFIGYLADAYIALDNENEAISTIEELAEREPDNPEIRLLLGTKIYRSAMEQLEKAWNLNREIEELEIDLLEPEITGSEEQQIRDQIEKLESEAATIEMEGLEQIDQAARHLEKATELDPENHESYHLLGIIYQNLAVDLFEKHDRAEDRMQAIEYDDEARMTLARAMEFYEKAVELNPENSELLETLYGIYIELGMTSKANQALDKLDVLQ